jgi:hypothetical protein
MRKYCIKYSFFFIFFILVFLLNQLYSGIVIYDCDGHKLLPKESAIAKMHKKKAERTIKEINSNNCLPKLWKDLINSSYDNDNQPIEIRLTCDKNFKDCGEAATEGSEIKIPYDYTVCCQSSCGCEESTILHEFMHALALVPDTDENDKKIRGCEVKCISGITRCKRYPPPGKACDCPK